MSPTDGVLNPNARPAWGRRVYGLRLLYQPRTRRQLALLTVAICAFNYVAQAIAQYVALPQKLLKFDFEQFRRAALDLDAGRSPYQYWLDMHCSSWCLGGYVDTPLIAETLRPFDVLPERVAAGAWIAVCHLAFLAAVLICYRALKDSVSTPALLMLLAAALAFQPLFDNLQAVQMGTVLLLLLSVTAVLYLRGPGRAYWTGAAASLSAFYKVIPVLALPVLLPLGWARAAGAERAAKLREFARGAAGVLTGVVVLGGAIALLVPGGVQYFTDVLPRIGGGTTVFENKSMPGFLAHALQLGGSPALHPLGLGLAVILVFVGAVVALGALVRPALADDKATRAAMYAGLVAALPIASTITFRHYLTIDLLALALLAPSLWPRQPGIHVPAATRWLAVAAYPLLSLDERLLRPLAIGDGISNPTTVDLVRVLALEYANLWGAIALWLAAAMVIWSATRPKITDVGRGT